MELRGQVNQYQHATDPRRWIFTINLSNGTTPFMIRVDGEEYQSNMYRIMLAKVLVREAFYRPTVEEFATLDRATKNYVLRGCLLHKPISEARPLLFDVGEDCKFEQFQEFCKLTYGEQVEHPG